MNLRNVSINCESPPLHNKGSTGSSINQESIKNHEPTSRRIKINDESQPQPVRIRYEGKQTNQDCCLKIENIE